MGKEIDIQVWKAQTIPNKINPKRTKPGHIMIETPKIKGTVRVLKSVKEKQKVMYRGTISYQQTFQQKICKPEGSA